MSSSLINKATKGVFWSAIERFSVQGIQFVLSIIIARLLLPSDYGLIAMLSIFLAVAQSFIDSGFSNALIQKQNRTEIDYSTVFYPLAELNKRIFKSANRFVVNVVYILKDCKCTYFP